MIGRLDRRRVGTSTRLLAGTALCFAGIAWSSSAVAQFDPNTIGTTINVPNAVTGTMTLTGTIDGQGGQGYFVAKGGVLTVNDGLLTNFVTQGGSGSGGGLGAGGAIFIDTGGTVNLNNTSFLHNTVIGGTGGTNSLYGGTLNGITSNVLPGTAPNGLNGSPGAMVFDNSFTFGDGNGNGVPGCCHTNARNATNGFGGVGGNGGPATNGWNSNPIAALNVAIATQNLTVNALQIAGWTVVAVDSLIAGTLSLADAANPFDTILAAIDAGKFTADVAAAILETTAAGLSLAANIQALAVAAGAQNAWNTRFDAGYYGNGGNGEAGGNGGKGSYGFGGGGGGQGGAYGLGTNGNTLDGIGGDGGNGGAGGFGAGGGAGGYAFGAGQNGEGVAGTSQNGTPGAGGAPGFGGGVGSMGGVTGGTGTCLGGTPGLACGGAGGYAFGGAIFVNSGATLTIQGNATSGGNSAIGGVSLNYGAGGGSTGKIGRAHV